MEDCGPKFLRLRSKGGQHRKAQGPGTHMQSPATASEFSLTSSARRQGAALAIKLAGLHQPYFGK